MFDALVEQRIREAVTRGEFDDLPGAGQPQQLDDDRMVPPDLRMAYRILKNAGFVPPEVEAFKEIAALERLIQSLDDGEERTQAQRKLRVLSLRLSSQRGGNLRLDAYYQDRLLQRFAE